MDPSKQKKMAVAQMLAGRSLDRIALSVKVNKAQIREWFDELPIGDFAAIMKPLLMIAVNNSVQSFSNLAEPTEPTKPNEEMSEIERAGVEKLRATSAKAHRENAQHGFRLLSELEGYVPKPIKKPKNVIPVKQNVIPIPIK